MTRFDGLTALSCVLCLAWGTTHSFGEDESQEPPLTYEVKLDDQTITFKEGETTEITGMFTNPKVTITPRQSRVFPYQGIRFKYPRSFGFEADVSKPIAKNWHLKGKHLRISLFVTPSDLSTGQYAEGMRKIMGLANTEITNAHAEITLGTETLQGTSVQFQVITKTQVIKLSTTAVLDIYKVPSQGHQPRFLLFQDTLDKDGNHSKEYGDVIAGMKTSFALTEYREFPRGFPDPNTTTLE